MLFNSFEFICFFFLVTSAYFLLPFKYRWMMLLGASCYFYMAFIPAYILILAITIVIDFYAGIFIESSAGPKRKRYLVISIVATCVVLFIFKYYNFFNTNINTLFNIFGSDRTFPAMDIILPIGLSFHTFQSLSYVIEVYNGNQKAEKNFGIYSLYVMFYPQLVAGPIERAENLLTQLRIKHEFSYERVKSGLALMGWGFFKKVVIADRVAIVVNQVYNDPEQYHGMPLIVATVLFAIQIYCDFSGYSDIALGAAEVMGITLMRNFKRPYFSESISEFWKRWHISLSTWFRDYVYIPLGGNRVVKWRMYYNLFITFMISGLWHGANWTFVAWGALHGIYLIIGTFTGKYNPLSFLSTAPRIRRAINVLITCALVTFAWIFFRANSMGDAWYIITHLGTGLGETLASFVNKLTGASKENWLASLNIDYNVIRLHPKEWILVVFPVLMLFTVHIIQERIGPGKRIRDIVFGQPLPVRWGVYCSGILLILLLGVFAHSEFIYFQF